MAAGRHPQGAGGRGDRLRHDRPLRRPDADAPPPAVALPLQGLDALSLVALTHGRPLVPAAPGYVGTFDAAVVFGVKALTGTAAGAAGYVVAPRLFLFLPTPPPRPSS